MPGIKWFVLQNKIYHLYRLKFQVNYLQKNGRESEKKEEQ
jgi:hypothetical protein